MTKMTVRELIMQGIDIDVYDDVCEELGIAFHGPQYLTTEGENEFAEVMDYPVVIIQHAYGGSPAAFVEIDDPEDAVWQKRLRKAKQFFDSAAGYCAIDDYDRWFKEG